MLDQTQLGSTQMNLLELCITLILITILSLGLPQLSLTAFQEKCSARLCLETLYLSRAKAMATDQDTKVQQTTDGLTVNQNNAIWLRLPLPPTLPTQLNVTSLGFKPTGRTLSAGTLTIGTKPYYVTLAVGYGKPNLR